MSYQSYKAHRASIKPAFDKYSQNIPQDTGITSPEGHQLLPMPPYVLTSSQLQAGTAPLSQNPAASLYSMGSENQILMASSAPSCDTGCLPINKPDPRVRQVKPLYKPFIFTGKDLPTTYNVVGMY